MAKVEFQYVDRNFLARKPQDQTLTGWQGPLPDLCGFPQPPKPNSRPVCRSPRRTGKKYIEMQ